MANLNEKKKIIYLITKSKWGGAQRYVYDLATNIDKNNFDCLVVSGGGGELIDKLKLANIKTKLLPELGRDVKIIDDLKTFLRLIVLFIKERPDIIHLNSSKIGGLGSLAGRLTRVRKIVFTIHGFAFNEDRSVFARTAIWILAYANIIFAHKIIAVSKNILKESIKFPFSKKKVSLIRHGIEKIDFLPTEETRIKLFGKENENKYVIGTIAELHKNKGLDNAILAYSEVKKTYPETILAIIGEGEERRKLENLIETLGLKNSVFLLGHIDNAQRYLKTFNLFILSSNTEALGYVLLEAGMAGLPIVATNVGGIPDIIENMGTGILVKQRNHKELAAGIKYSISNKEVTKELAKNLNNKIIDEFNIEKMVRETSKLYS